MPDPGYFQNEALQQGLSVDEINKIIADLQNAAPGGPASGSQDIQDRIGGYTGARNEVLARTRRDTTDQANKDAVMNQYNTLFGQYQDQAVNRLNKQTNPQRSRLVSEEAALGRLDSPATRYSLNRFDDAANNNLTDLLGQLAGTQAGGAIDYNKFLQNLGLQREQLSQQQTQFGQNLQFQKELAAQQKRQFEDSHATDWMDTLNKGSNAFSSAFGAADKGLSLGKDMFSLFAKPPGTP